MYGRPPETARAAGEEARGDNVGAFGHDGPASIRSSTADDRGTGLSHRLTGTYQLDSSRAMIRVGRLNRRPARCRPTSGKVPTNASSDDRQSRE